MNKRILITACVLAILAIILGAFGAHKLKELLSPHYLNSFETAVRYQMYHVFFLLFLGIYDKIDNQTKRNIYRVVCLGILFFSGSIYLLSTQEITGINISKIGIITPIGGLFLILAWVLLLKSLLKIVRDS